MQSKEWLNDLSARLGLPRLPGPTGLNLSRVKALLPQLKPHINYYKSLERTCAEGQISYQF